MAQQKSGGESSASVRGAEKIAQESRVPDATDRLANLMAQYMEAQVARSVPSNTTLHEQFMKLNPPEFKGATDPLVAEEWLRTLETIFEVMGVPDERKLSLSTFMLRGKARNWWEVTRQMTNAQPGGVPITWQRFVEVFNDQYFPRIYQHQKEQEFILLKQGKMSVVEYEEQFMALSRFAPDLVRTEGAKCRRFQQGLELAIRSRVCVFEITRYRDLVNKSKIVELDVKEMTGRLEQFKKRRFDSRASTLRQRPSESAPTANQGRVQFNPGSSGSRFNNARSIRSSRERGASRPPSRFTSSRPLGSNTGEMICDRCRAEKCIVRDCPVPSTDKCYQCGQLGHIARNCPQNLDTASSVGNMASEGRGTMGVAQKGLAMTPESPTQARVYAMTMKDVQATPNVVTGVNRKQYPSTSIKK